MFIRIAEQVNHLLNDPSRPFGNVAEYAKREIFWNVIKDKAAKFDISNVSESIITKKDASLRQSSEKEKQKFTNKLEIETAVKITNPETWRSVLKYLIDTDSETPAKKTLLQRAISNPLSLSQLQCGILYDILSEYKSHFRDN